MSKLFTILCLMSACFYTSCEAYTLIGIAGGTGSGKTTFSKNIQQKLHKKCTFISQDSYYRDLSHLSLAERDARNFDHPEAIEFHLLAKHLKELKEGKSIEVPTYEFERHIRLPQTTTVSPDDIIILEGILLYAVPEIRDLCDIKIFIDTDDDIRLLRRIDRDMSERGRSLESVALQYTSTVKPMHDLYVESSKAHADIIVPHGGHNEVALDLVLTKLNQITKEKANMQTEEPIQVVGISVRTTNENAQSMKDIPELWGRFLSENIPSQIPNIRSPKVYAVYSDYELDHTKPYTLTIGCEVSNFSEIPQGFKSVTIPRGNYTKFTAEGDPQAGSVYNEWVKIWGSDLERTYTADFEVYDETAMTDPNNAKIDICIATR